jgi:hypothetical protein
MEWAIGEGFIAMRNQGEGALTNRMTAEPDGKLSVLVIGEIYILWGAKLNA